MAVLVEAGYQYQTVRMWFFKESGPSRAKLQNIEEVLDRKVEIVDPGMFPESVPDTIIPEIEPAGTGFCWVPFSAWEGLTKAQVCELCIQKNAVCRKAEAAA